MIYFGNRQVGKTHTAITKLVEAYNNKKGKILVVAPTMEQESFICKLLVNRKVDIKDIITTNVLPIDDKVDGFKIDYRYIEGLDRIIGDDENTFAIVNNSTLIVRHDKKYQEFCKEYKPDSLMYFDNSVLGEKELKEREILELKERIAKLETEIKMMDNKKSYKETI